jgi:hypothetical protein
VKENSQDGGLRTYTFSKKPSLFQTLFGEISTEIDVLDFNREVEKREKKNWMMAPPAFLAMPHPGSG